jgi:hypothetical protein
MIERYVDTSEPDAAEQPEETEDANKRDPNDSLHGNSSIEASVEGDLHSNTKQNTKTV